MNSLLHSQMAMDFLNGRVAKYAVIHSLEAESSGYRAAVQLKGSNERLTIHLKEIRLSKDKQHVSLHGFDANQEWLTNLLCEFVEGREFALPDFPGIGAIIPLL